MTFDFDPQVNSVKEDHYREWREEDSTEGRQKRSAAWLPHLARDAVPPVRRRRRTAQLVPAARVRRASEHENQLNDDNDATRFQVNVRYQPRDGI